MAQSFLRVVSGPKEGLTVPLSVDEPLVVGRNRGDVLLDDPLVSGAHCRVIRRDGRFVLQDLGSTNGTVVNGQLAREVVLCAGDEIGIGSSRLILYTGESDGDSTTHGGRHQLDVAWLLDKELKPDSGDQSDVIGQGLRLPPGIHIQVTIESGPDSGSVVEFNRGSVSIGRHAGDVPLADVEVSRRHAFIEVFGSDMIFLRDVSSTNGTYHNGRRVRMSRLRAGDTIGVGQTVMRVGITE